MGFFDSFSDLLEAALPWSTAEAEAPKEEEEKEDEKDASEESEESKDKPEEEAEEEEEEEEEDEDMVDPKEKLEEECKSSKACSPAKHHFDECVERVTGAHEHSTDKKHPDEDCVEEFFHLAHCATACAAPKLWAVLK
ncbi:related to ubiquinol-cytochrome c reductase complex subunit [Rhynchosporium agropyri]|uniref:Cytochrome b-c1 complex subunit 6, mitochondrial n=1 Tax=Rhynchosporium agropyri TaxID=914238 RepID=A0A1E1KGU6_9HELO|nr:related to ubiquinol-cytochrome c reductase complex subunit [Rhynchosporium agropyri]